MNGLHFLELKSFLDEKYKKFDVPGFIPDDPISVPHQFDKKEDIEIAGFLTATIAWGQRKSIVANANKLLKGMGYYPHEFIMNASEKDIGAFDNFVHRTFNGTDATYFLQSLQNIYTHHEGLEKIFNEGYQKDKTLFSTLIHFRQIFFELPHEIRTEKHVANVAKKATGKRLCMYLRWMVRSDNQGVDFGLWKKIPAAALMLPLDVHTSTISRRLGLLNRKQNDWQAVEEVTQNLRKFDPLDPVKYDFALFGLGVNKEL